VRKLEVEAPALDSVLSVVSKEGLCVVEKVEEKEETQYYHLKACGIDNIRC
jgi:hypothetical protein